MILYICKKEEGYLTNRKGNEMNVTQYEHLIPSVATAEITSDKMNEVVAFIKENPGTTCKEIGLYLYGKAYEYRPDLYRDSAHNRVAIGYASHLGHILAVLCDKGYAIRKNEKTSEPVVDREGNIIFSEHWVLASNDEPLMITVTDEQGRRFQIDNPWRLGSKMVKEKKPLFKTITRFYWNKGMD